MVRNVPLARHLSRKVDSTRWAGITRRCGTVWSHLEPSLACFDPKGPISESGGFVDGRTGVYAPRPLLAPTSTLSPPIPAPECECTPDHPHSGRRIKEAMAGADPLMGVVALAAECFEGVGRYVGGLSGRGVCTADSAVLGAGPLLRDRAAPPSRAVRRDRPPPYPPAQCTTPACHPVSRTTTSSMLLCHPPMLP